MLAVALASDGPVVGHFHATRVDEGWGSDGDAFQFAEEIAHVGRLVISVHLPDDGIAVLVVMPQGIVAPCGGSGGGIDADVVVFGAHHHLLAPVAEEVGLQTGRCLGVVVGQRTREVGNDTASIFDNDTLRVIASRTVERLLAEVAVPVDAEVLGDMVLRALGDGTDEVGVAGRNALTAGELVGEVAHDGTSVVIASREPVENLAGGGITEVVAGVVFVASEELLSVAVGVEVAHMLGIAVSQSGGGQSLAVVVDGHRTEHNLIPSVPVDVGHDIVVVTLSVPAAWRIVVPGPAGRELVGGGIHVVGNHLVAGIDTTGEEDAGLLAVQIRGTEEILRRAVAVAIAPGFLEIALVGL